MAKSISLGLLRKGRIRTINEDNLFVLNTMAMSGQTHDFEFATSSEDSMQFYAVSDGMGGGLGELAARRILQVLDHQRQLILQGSIRFEFMNFARAYINEARQSLRHLQLDHQGLSAGSMVSMLIIHHDMAYTISLGTSRIYLFRDNQLYRMTDDHVNGEPGQYQLTRFVGLSSHNGEIVPENMTRTILNRGDIFLITSDGITQNLEDNELVACLSEPSAFVNQIRSIQEAAWQKGGRENMSMVGIKIIDPLLTGHTADRRKPVQDPVTGKQRQPEQPRIKSTKSEIRGDSDTFEENYRHRWFRPLLIFLVFVLVGLVVGKLIFSLPGWWQALINWIT